MRLSVPSLLGVVLLISSAPLWSQTNEAVEKALQTKEQALWQAWKDHDPKPVEAAVPDDAVNIADGMMAKGRQQILKDMMEPGCAVSSFALSDWNFIWIDKDTVIMTYSATQDVSCKGQKQPGNIIASSLWVKRHKKWVSPFHQETPAG